MFRRTAAVAFLFVFALTSVAAAVEHPAELFTPDVSLVIRLKNPEATTKKVAEFAEAINPGFGPMVTARAEGLGVVISNPERAGVDPAQDWWVGVYASGESRPVLVYVVPAKDMQAMQDAVKETIGANFLAHESWGIYSEDAQAVEKVRARIDGKEKALVDDVDQALRETFERGDLSVFINVSQLAKVYDASIADAQDQLRATAENAPPGAEAMLGMYLELSKPLFQSLDDATGAVVTLTVDKKAAALEALGKVKEGSETAKLLDSTPSENKLLTRLPADGQAYYAMSKIPAALQEWSLNIMQATVQATDGDEEALDEIKDVMRRMQKLDMGGSAGMIAITAEGAEKGLRTASVMDVAQPQQMRLLTKELIAAQADLSFGGVKSNYQLTQHAETFGKYKADTLKVEQEFEQNPFIDVQQIYDVLFGEEGVLTRMVFTDKQVVQTLGGGKEAMSKFLKRVEQSEPPALSTELQITRDGLPQQANLIGMLDLPGALSRAIRLFLNSGLIPIAVDPEAISIRETNSYFGISLGTEPQGVRVKVFVPVEQAKNSYRFGMEVFQVMQDMRQQQIQ